MKQLSILMLGGAKRVSMARLLRKAAEQRGISLSLYSYELSMEVPIAIEAEVLPGTLWRDPDIYDKLWRVVNEKSIDIVIPFVDPAIAIAAKLRDMHLAPGERHIYVPTGTPEKAAAMLDKAASAAAFERAGLEAPATITTPTTFPVICKPRYGSASKGILVVESARDWEHQQIDQAAYLVQEYIADRTEFTVDCFVDSRGTITACQPRKRIATAGGEVTDTLTVDTPQIAEAARTALQRLGLRGAVTVQYLLDNATGRLMIMEINPRLGGGAVASVYAGSDIPGMIIDDALGGNAGEPVPPAAGVRMTRYMQEVIFNQ